jgi:hypothetical protein
MAVPLPTRVYLWNSKKRILRKGIIEKKKARFRNSKENETFIRDISV